MFHAPKRPTSARSQAPRTLGALAVALLVSCAGKVSEEDARQQSGDGTAGTASTQPGDIPASEQPLDPGTPIDDSPAPATQATRTAVSEALAEVADLSPDELLSRHTLAHSALSYAPGSAAQLDLIQASDLALGDEELALLEESGFVISTRREFPTFAYGYETIYGQDLPVYISADSILNALHRSFDDILKQIEVVSLVPQLESLLEAMRGNLTTSEAVPSAAAADADFYLAVAASLLKGAQVGAVRGADEEQIRAFFEGASAASGMQEIELFGVPRKVDFSQFTPRGHYTESAELERYFRAMMWLGRIDFRLIETQEDHTQVFHRRQFDAMLAIHSLLGADEQARFQRIDGTIEAFVGESDYMRVPEVDALLADLGVTGLGDAAALDDATIADAIVAEGYGSQRISSHIMINGLGAGTMPLSSSFAFFGQRYVVDSHVFSNVVFDRVADGEVLRMMPDPLDVAYAALDNDQAVALLGDELARYDYASELASMRVLVNQHEPEFWDANLYNLWLSSLRALSPRPSEIGDPSAVGLPTIAGTERWGRRLLNAQLASWAELRHDTILYVKQSYTGGVACEFPDAYVDPYPEFYGRVMRFAESGAQVASDALEGVDADLAGSVTSYFAHLRDVSSMLEGMATSQRAGVAFTAEQMAFVNDAVVLQVEGCGWPTRTTGWYGRLFYDPYQAAESDPVIADVHTQPTDTSGTMVGRVLHVGTGAARLMVVTADTCQGPRAYAGLASTYYEVVTENFERLTDDDWQSELWQSPPADVDWVQPLLAP